LDGPFHLSVELTFIFARFYSKKLILTSICLTILGIQIIYFSLLLSAFVNAKVQTTEAQPPVSIIVCAHDEEANLRELVPKLLSQDYPAFELIIVEDRSNDGSYDFLLEATNENKRLKMVRVSQKPEHITGKKFALTLGIKAARYDWVLLTDADCLPTNNRWIASMCEKIQGDKKIVLGFSPYVKEPGLLNSFIRFESYLTGIQFIGLALLGTPYMGVGRNLLYRKELFLDHKGFNSHLSVVGGDDDLFVNQHATEQNTVVSIGGDSVVFSKPKTTWAELLHQKFRHLSVGKRYKFSHKIVLGIFSLSWILSWFLVVPAIPFSLWPALLTGVFLVRWILEITLFYLGPEKLGGSFEGWRVPYLDFMYAFYYLVTGAKALFVKKVKWKN
jgi:glycosyltransferase involved in cell wall biosynthesis